MRKLPAVLTELSDKAAATLRDANVQAGSKAAELRDKAGTTDFAALRDNAASVAATLAQVAQDRAVSAYTALVARGERVVGTGVVASADVVNADIETTGQPQAVESAAEATKAIAEAAPAPKPRKRAKPASSAE